MVLIASRECFKGGNTITYLNYSVIILRRMKLGTLTFFTITLIRKAHLKTTLNRTIFGRITISKMTFSRIPLSLSTLSRPTFSRMTLRRKKH
jgi:hypothetical protein